MRFSSRTIATLLLSSVVSSASLSLFAHEAQQAIDSATKVPGDNPLEYCQASHDSDILIIEKVDLTPNPPVPGSTLTIEAQGELLEDIEIDGDDKPYVMLQVKYGLIRLVNTRADLCEQVANVDLECPLKKGKMTITKDVEIPAEVPPGKYTVLADVYTWDDKHITCLTATVVFSK